MYYEKVKLYEGRDDVTLASYVWDDAADLLNGKTRPAVIICPGGAYLNLSNAEGEPVALAFANMGYNAFVLRYSVYSEGIENADMFTSGGQGVKEHCIFPKPMQDIGAAMLYIREHSEAWHINMDQVAICGFSAGAHNCAMYSVYWNKPEIAGFFGVDPQMMKPAASILAYPITDYVYLQAGSGLSEDPVAASLFEDSSLAFLGTTKPSDKLLYKVSPVYLVDQNTPPTFLWATSEDNLVPVQHSILMARSLADAGIPFELHIFEKGMHGLGTAAEAGAGNLMQINDDAAQWIPMCHKWLQKRFRLPLPERPFWMDLMESEGHKPTMDR